MTTTRSVRTKGDLRDMLDAVNTPVLINLWHPRSRSSRAITKRLSRLAHRAGDEIAVNTLNLREDPDAAETFRVERVPALVILHEGSVRARLHGEAKIQRFADWVEEELAA